MEFFLTFTCVDVRHCPLCNWVDIVVEKSQFSTTPSSVVYSDEVLCCLDVPGWSSIDTTCSCVLIDLCELQERPLGTRRNNLHVDYKRLT